jgi:hypothetical protein
LELEVTIWNYYWTFSDPFPYAAVADPSMSAMDLPAPSARIDSGGDDNTGSAYYAITGTLGFVAEAVGSIDKSKSLAALGRNAGIVSTFAGATIDIQNGRYVSGAIGFALGAGAATATFMGAPAVATGLGVAGIAWGVGTMFGSIN